MARDRERDRDEPADRAGWFRRRRRPPVAAPDRAVGDFGREGQADEGGDSDTT